MQEPKYTKLSECAVEQLTGQDITPGEAVRFFSSELQLRTFGDLINGLMAQKGVSQSALLERMYPLREHMQKDSLRKRIQV